MKKSKIILILSLLMFIFLVNCMNNSKKIENPENSKKSELKDETTDLRKANKDTLQKVTAKSDTTKLTKNMDLSPSEIYLKRSNEEDNIKSGSTELIDNNAREENFTYSVQVFAGNNKTFADNLKSKLEKNYNSLKPIIVYEENLWKVRLGSFNNKDEAQKLKEELINAGYKDAWIVIRPSK